MPVDHELREGELVGLDLVRSGCGCGRRVWWVWSAGEGGAGLGWGGG